MKALMMLAARNPAERMSALRDATGVTAAANP